MADRFDFDLLQLLRIPLREQMYFSELTADWVLLTLERLMPLWWGVNGVSYMPHVTRKGMGGRFDPANYFCLWVIVGEVEAAPGVRWVARNDYGELDNDKCETVMVCEAMREPGRWQLEAVCYQQYAVGTFHELVQWLREAGGMELQVADETVPHPWAKYRIRPRRWERWRRILNEYIPAGLTQEQMAENEDIDVSRIKDDYKRMKGFKLLPL